MNGAGYVRLRWKIGTREYVERYERDEGGALVCERERWRPGMARKKREPRVDRDELRRLHGEGLSQPQIAKRLGCNSATISRALASLGLKAHREQVRGSKAEAFNRELDRMRPLVAARSGGRCEVRIDGRCRKKAGHVHHRKLRGNGGDNALENLLHVCSSCHSRLHLMVAVAYERGWLVESWNEPSEVPVLLGLAGANGVR